MIYVFLVVLIIFYMICDVNYFVRTLFTVWSSRMIRNKKYPTLSDVTTVYGICTLQDCDIWFENLRLARLVRDLDFARYHFYDQTGIYQRSCQLGIHSLQGSTLTVTLSPIPLFAIYKINTKLVYWDERSLFFEHEVVTVRDNEVRSLLVSRQYAIRNSDASTTNLLLEELPGSQSKTTCPEYVKSWLDSMEISSAKLRIATKDK
ncbi:PREDICTED: protein THEM6-like [Papilio polytes]|uniref:protein THEM6-like n=1 Tax=Papilio polytes TaxID=76194 RepID=UPI000676092D|nr:PREDICTED: protein THEM6-like [Papilio polytes]